MSTPSINELEQRLTTALLSDGEIAQYACIVEQDVPWLIARVRELEAVLHNMKSYADEKDALVETLAQQRETAEARAVAAEKERDALRQQVANLTYSNESHRKCAELWRAAAIERDTLRTALAKARDGVLEIRRLMERRSWKADDANNLILDVHKLIVMLLSQLPAEGTLPGDAGHSNTSYHNSEVFQKLKGQAAIVADHMAQSRAGQAAEAAVGTIYRSAIAETRGEIAAAFRLLAKQVVESYYDIGPDDLRAVADALEGKA